MQVLGIANTNGRMVSFRNKVLSSKFAGDSHIGFMLMSKQLREVQRETTETFYKDSQSPDRERNKNSSKYEEVIIT